MNHKFPLEVNVKVKRAYQFDADIAPENSYVSITWQYTS